ncbi:hypothetical protein DFH06DRAFT_1153679 [Mycena polygramma]|nr:hypothetical protein DFH06DRAFT_1153679 [Mycena polygramma]
MSHPATASTAACTAIFIAIATSTTAPASCAPIVQNMVERCNFVTVVHDVCLPKFKALVLKDMSLHDIKFFINDTLRTSWSTIVLTKIFAGLYRTYFKCQFKNVNVLQQLQDELLSGQLYNTVNYRLYDLSNDNWLTIEDIVFKCATLLFSSDEKSTIANVITMMDKIDLLLSAEGKKLLLPTVLILAPLIINLVTVKNNRNTRLLNFIQTKGSSLEVVSRSCDTKIFVTAILVTPSGHLDVENKCRKRCLSEESLMSYMWYETQRRKGKEKNTDMLFDEDHNAIEKSSEQFYLE